MRLGTISPPGWVSFSGQELKAMADAPLEVIDQPMPVAPDFAFGVEEIRGAAPAIEAAACALAEQRVDAILQIGGPFAVLHGLAGARDIQAHVSTRVGVPFEMMALSMLASLERAQTRQVMLCSSYYPDEWATAYEDFLAASGKVVRGRRSFLDLGALPTQDPSTMTGAFEEISLKTVLEALQDCAVLGPGAALYLAGIPCPLLAHHADLRRVSSSPVITYLDSYTHLLARVGVPLKPAFAPRGS